MRKLSGLVLVGALVVPVAMAQAAEVSNTLTNNMFASAVANDLETNSTTAVFVSREKGHGAPRDTITVIVSGPDGFSFVTGTLPKNALKINKKKASVDVAISDIEITSEAGDVPADGVVSVSWDADDVTRTTGNTVFEVGDMRVHIHGHSTSAIAAITGSVYGAALAGATGDISTVHNIVQILVTN